MFRIHAECDKREISEEGLDALDILLDEFEAYEVVHNAYYYHWDRDCEEEDLLLFQEWYEKYTTNSDLILEDDGEEEVDDCEFEIE